jgi:hypothetical protein
MINDLERIQINLAFCLDELAKPRKISIRAGASWAEIWTREFRNMKQGCQPPVCADLRVGTVSKQIRLLYSAIFIYGVTAGKGRAIAEAVSRWRRWLPTAAARVQSRVWSSGICGGQSGVGAGCLRVLRFPLPFILPNSPSSQSPGAGTIGQ